MIVFRHIGGKAIKERAIRAFKGHRIFDDKGYYS
jgi:hypothetical protein